MREEKREYKGCMHAVDALPPSYQESMRFDLMGDQKMLKTLRQWSVKLFFASLVLLLIPALLRIFQTGAVAGMHPAYLLVFLAVILLAQVVTVLLHEWIHGLFFRYFGRAKVEFGFSGAFAYASCPGCYFDRNSYLLIGLAPLAILSGLSYLLLYMLPLGWTWVVLASVFVLNTVGAVGDLFVAAKLIRAPEDVFCLDTREGISVYALREANMRGAVGASRT